MSMNPKNFDQSGYVLQVYPAREDPLDKNAELTRAVLAVGVYTVDETMVEVWATDKNIYRVITSEKISPQDLVVLSYIGQSPNGLSRDYCWKISNAAQEKSEA